ncbi:MAG TPA: lipid-binding SYLF domain-containing protein [Acetobacteraceae bacterium]|nr:lipid-binding SYLF domain-containing protein [Acetobacteraceae bacterium]
MGSLFRHAAPAALFCGFVAGLTFTPSVAWGQSAQTEQDLVDRATLAVQEVLGSDEAGQARDVLPSARAVMVCPRVLRIGFFFGGEGGGCVLLARGGQGTWSAPAFYEMGGGSFGLQAGLQDAAVVMMIQTQAGLRAVMDNQFRLGANASIALVTLGAGVEGATSTALNADIIAYAKTRGLFAGISLQGTVMSSSSAGDQAYYGQPVGPVDILLAMRVNNPGADPLRAALMRFGTSRGTRTYAAAPAYTAAPGYASPPDYAPPVQGPPAYTAPVQQQPLSPPR